MIIEASTSFQPYMNIFSSTIGLADKAAIQHPRFNLDRPLRPEHVHVQPRLDGEPLWVIEKITRLLVQELMNIHCKRWTKNPHITTTKINFYLNAKVQREWLKSVNVAVKEKKLCIIMKYRGTKSKVNNWLTNRSRSMSKCWGTEIGRTLFTIAPPSHSSPILFRR